MSKNDLFDFDENLTGGFDIQLENLSIEEKNSQLKKAVVLCLKNKFDEALEIYEELIKNDINCIQAYIGILRVHSENFKKYDGDVISQDLSIIDELGDGSQNKDENYNNYVKQRKEYFLELERKANETKAAEKKKKEDERKRIEKAKADEEKLINDSNLLIINVRKSLNQLKVLNGISEKQINNVELLCEDLQKTVIMEDVTSIKIKKINLENSNRDLLIKITNKRKEIAHIKQIEEIKCSIHQLSKQKNNKKWCYEVKQLEKNIKDYNIDTNTLPDEERQLLNQINKNYKKSLKHYHVKDGIASFFGLIIHGIASFFKWSKDFLPTVIAVLFTISAIVLVILGSRIFAIIAFGLSLVSLIASIIIINRDYDDVVIGWISSIASGIFFVVAAIQWFFAFGVSDFIIKDGVLKDYYGNERIVEVPDGVVEIKGSAFYHVFNNNKKVEQVILPDGVKSIGDFAFKGCKSLEEIVLPDSLEIIYENAFYDCSSLKSVTIPDNVTTIGYDAFQNCSNLTEVYIGSGVKEIGSGAFSYCKYLETIYYNGTQEEWNKIDKCDGNGFLESPWDENAGNYTIVFLK